MEEFLSAGMHWKILNFAIFLGVLVFLLRKPVKDFLASRSHRLEFDIGEAQKQAREARLRQEEIQRRLSKIDLEVSTLIRNMEQEGELEKKKIMENAERLAARMSQDTERIAAQEVRKAREILKAQAVQISMELAEKILREKFQESDQKKLADQYLSQLESERV